jgi:hypothetical protein
LDGRCAASQPLGRDCWEVPVARYEALSDVCFPLKPLGEPSIHPHGTTTTHFREKIFIDNVSQSLETRGSHSVLGRVVDLGCLQVRLCLPQLCTRQCPCLATGQLCPISMDTESPLLHDPPPCSQAGIMNHTAGIAIFDWLNGAPPAVICMKAVVRAFVSAVKLAPCNLSNSWPQSFQKCPPLLFGQRQQR